MRESRTYGSVRGALSNERPYRDRSEMREPPHPPGLCRALPRPAPSGLRAALADQLHNMPSRSAVDGSGSQPDAASAHADHTVLRGALRA
jgi:hypothetical protein